MHAYALLFVRGLAATVLIETAVLLAFFLWRRRELSGALVTRVCVSGIVPSCVTLPFVWFVFPALIEDRTLFLVAAELFAFVAEIPMIRAIAKTTWPEAIAASLLANGVSFISGLFLGMS
jgi:hypothetical protein